MNNWGYWKTTDEQALAIKNRDITARNEWYADNETLLRKMACNWLQKAKALGFSPLCEVNDLVNQVYLDLPYLCWDNGKALTCYIKRRSFKWCEFGGFSFLHESGSKWLDHRPEMSLDETATTHHRTGENETELPLLDIFATAPDTAEVYEQTTQKDNTAEVMKIAASYLSPQQREFVGYLIEGYRPSKIAEKMGLKQWGSLTARVRQKLKAHFPDIESALSKIA